MNKKVTFRHMEHVPDIANYVDGALARVVEALENEPTPIYLEMVIEPGRPHAHHQASLLLSSPNYSIDFKQEGPEPYRLIDKVCDDMYRKIHKEKKKRIQERKKADSYKGA